MATRFRHILSLHHLRTMATEASQAPGSAKIIDGTALAKYVPAPIYRT